MSVGSNGTIDDLISETDLPVAQAIAESVVVDCCPHLHTTPVDYERFAATYPCFRSVPDIRHIVVESIVCGHYDGLITLVP